MTATASANLPVIELRDIAKSFSGVSVLHDVSFAVMPGEVHVLVGENGAGKSTLIKIIGGIHAPSAGHILFEGRRVSFADPRAAEAHGIHLVHQEFSTVPDLSVAENIFLGREPRRFGLLDWRRMRRESAQLLADLGVQVPVDRRVGELSVADRQMIEIARALKGEARLIVFDEPTAALSLEETRLLLERIRALRGSDTRTGIVYISHRLDEVFAVADRITVIKDGAWIATEAARDLSEARVVALMVGRALQEIYPAAAGRQAGETALAARDFAVGAKVRVSEVKLHAGEIVGLAGMVGSGRTTLARGLFGSLPGSGEVMLGGEPYAARHPKESLRRGMAYLTEDRREDGLFLDQSVIHNLTAATLRRHTVRGLLRLRRESAAVSERVAQFNVRSAGIQVPVINLSGGNQQKVLLARLLELELKVLILDEPTRGVDVGAKAEIYRLIDQLARRGVAVLVISSELNEIIGLCDRVLVMRAGRIVAQLPRVEASEEAIMSFAARRGDIGEALTTAALAS